MNYVIPPLFQTVTLDSPPETEVVQIRVRTTFHRLERELVPEAPAGTFACPRCGDAGLRENDLQEHSCLGAFLRGYPNEAGRALQRWGAAHGFLKNGGTRAYPPEGEEFEQWARRREEWWELGLGGGR